MMVPFLLLLAPFTALIVPTLATNINLPARQTSTPERNGQAPVPRIPEATPTPHPHWNREFPRRRADSSGSDTCGYISGADTYFPLTCGTSWTCTNSAQFRGCCKSSGCTSSASFFTICYDASAKACSGSVGPNTLCCTRATEYPYCVTYLWSTSLSPGDMFTEYNCDASRYSGQYILTAEVPSTASTSSASSASSASSSPAKISTKAPSSATSASSTASVSLGSFPANNTDSSSGNAAPPNIPVIIGGAVGAIVVLAIIGVSVSLCIRKTPAVNPSTLGGYTSAPPPMAQFASGLGPPHAPLGVSSPVTSISSPVSDPRYSYGPGTSATSPMSPIGGDYPSPTGSPTPLFTQHQPLGHEQCDFSHQGYTPAKHGPHAPAEMSRFGPAGYPAELA